MLGKGGSPTQATLEARVKTLVSLLSEGVRTFPAAWLAEGDTTLIYCGFDHRRKQFRLFEIYLGKSRITVKPGQLSSKRLLCYGSGAKKAKQLIAEIGFGSRSLTKVEILNVLKKVIEDRSVRDVGGAPQMITIGKRSSRVVGFKWGPDGNPQRTLFGLPVHFRSSLRKVCFLDKNFHPS